MRSEALKEAQKRYKARNWEKVNAINARAVNKKYHTDKKYNQYHKEQSKINYLKRKNYIDDPIKSIRLLFKDEN